MKKWRWFAVFLLVSEKRKLLNALYEGMKQGSMSNMAMCFEPRHGIRATYSSNDTVDFLICFSCGQYCVYKNGKQWRNYFSITAAARDIFNESLQRAGIKNPY